MINLRKNMMRIKPAFSQYSQIILPTFTHKSFDLHSFVHKSFYIHSFTNHSTLSFIHKPFRRFIPVAQAFTAVGLCAVTT